MSKWRFKVYFGFGPIEFSYWSFAAFAKGVNDASNWGLRVEIIGKGVKP